MITQCSLGIGNNRIILLWPHWPKKALWHTPTIENKFAFIKTKIRRYIFLNTWWWKCYNMIIHLLLFTIAHQFFTIAHSLRNKGIFSPTHVIKVIYFYLDWEKRSANISKLYAQNMLKICLKCDFRSILFTIFTSKSELNAFHMDDWVAFKIKYVVCCTVRRSGKIKIKKCSD